ncbi:MAG: hypothetical protein LBB88_04910 [Planctomycetaceae bacterium]|nr:hypothetical protein [Planctomycetaceae bacterium]
MEKNFFTYLTRVSGTIIILPVSIVVVGELIFIIVSAVLNRLKKTKANGERILIESIGYSDFCSD